MVEDNESLETLIVGLEEAIREAEGGAFRADDQNPPKRCLVNKSNEGYMSKLDREPKQALLFMIEDGQMVLRGKDSFVRNQKLQVRAIMGLGPEGETSCNGIGEVTLCQRIPGASYEITLELFELELNVVPVSKRFLEFADKGDFAGWNRFCAALEDGPILRGLDLKNAPLANFDLCMADLSDSNLEGANLANANLSGADLGGCNLDGVRLTGADLFRVRIPRKYMALLGAAGLVEVESAIFI